MATEKRLIYMDDTMDKLRAYAERKHEAGHIELSNGILKAVNYMRNNIVRVDAVEVVHGQWDEIPNKYMSVSTKNGSYSGHATSCSVCHEVNPNAFKTNYCPNCGAKMDLGENE